MTKKVGCSISKKVWQLRNSRLKKLPRECRERINEMVKEDVDQCFKNNGMYDPICKSLAKEAMDLEEYLLER